MSYYFGFIGILNGNEKDLEVLYSSYSFIKMTVVELTEYNEVNRQINLELNNQNQGLKQRTYWKEGEWLVLEDLSSEFCIDNDELEKVQAKIKKPIISFFASGEDTEYSFMYKSIDKLRRIYVSDCKIEEDIGVKLIEEKGLNINEKITCNDLLDLAKAFEIDWENRKNISSFKIVKLKIPKKIIESNRKKMNKLDSIMTHYYYKKYLKENKNEKWWKFW